MYVYESTFISVHVNFMFESPYMCIFMSQPVCILIHVDFMFKNLFIGIRVSTYVYVSQSVYHYMWIISCFFFQVVNITLGHLHLNTQL